MTQRKLNRLSLAICAALSTAMTAPAMAQPALGSLLGGGGLAALGGGGSDSSSDPAMAFSNGAGEGSEMAPSENGGGGESSGGGRLPLPGLGENGGGESGAGAGTEGGEQGMPVAQQDEESGEGEGFGRHDGVIMFRDEQTGGDPEGMRLPATTTHYTLSENLQSVRTCTEANDACVIQASVVFRDGEIERVRLFDEYIVGEPVPHEPDSGKHDPAH